MKQQGRIAMIVNKDTKFTTRDKAKEMAMYVAECPETELKIENTPEFSPNGVAIVKTFTYKNNLTQIKYNKWIVEGVELASQMKLPGYEKHDKLVQGSSVRVLAKQFDHIFNFYNQDAQDIIEVCEQNHMQQILQTTNNLQR